MPKRLQSVGNSSGVIIDKPILELLRIAPDTELDISTDGIRLIITPLRNRKVEFAGAQHSVLDPEERALRKWVK